MTNKLLESMVQVGRDVGSEKEVTKILTSFYEKMSHDALVGFFFQGKDLTHIIQQQSSFISRSMGLRTDYTGKSPNTAHKMLPPILKGHFDRRLVLLRETLEEFRLPAKSIEAWVKFEETFRKGIVENEGPLSQRQKYRGR